jgi:hypothetical protein
MSRRTSKRIDPVGCAICEERQNFGFGVYERSKPMLDAFEQSVPCILSFDTALVICPGVKECQVSGSRFLRNFRHIERYHIRPNPPECDDTSSASSGSPATIATLENFNPRPTFRQICMCVCRPKLSRRDAKWQSKTVSSRSNRSSPLAVNSRIPNSQ